MSETSNTSSSQIEERGKSLFAEQYWNLCKETDYLFAKFLVVQWMAAILVATFVSPRTWIGDTPYVHFHIWLATLFGGIIISLPLFLVYMRPGQFTTRIAIAISQMLYAALIIHLSGGRIETHFYVFGSLAFLACYRDWKVIVVATVVVAIDHFVRGVWWPLSAFGVSTESPFRWMEHAGWVIFEDIFLIRISLRGIQEQKKLCQRQADLELVNTKINEQVHQQIARYTEANARLDMEILEKNQVEQELKEREYTLRKIMSSTIDPMITTDSNGIVQEASLSTYDVLGWMPEELIGNDISVIIPETFQKQHHTAMSRAKGDSASELSNKLREVSALRRDGTTVPIEILIWKTMIPGQNDPLFTGIIRDISLRKEAEEKHEAMYAQLLDTTRQAGMAEVATGVLHNVGNVLNSVNVSVNLIEDKLKVSQVKGLKKVLELIQSHRDDLGEFISEDDKGKRLPEYITKLAEYLVAENESISEELSELSSNIGHIKEIVTMQQSYAKVSGSAEIINVSEILGNALKTNDSSLGRHCIKVIREYEDVPLINSDRHKLMQILVNLISNAKQALYDVRGKERELILRLSSVENEHIKIEVEDNGVGITEENLSKIFQHGFTTKDSGHGFGLHSCALAARELGGSLSVYSKGEGQGAR
ncbi:MAG: PAS domain-containing sensor histidine kinase, partial [Planctomycetota bacterium]